MAFEHENEYIIRPNTMMYIDTWMGRIIRPSKFNRHQMTLLILGLISNIFVLAMAIYVLIFKAPIYKNNPLDHTFAIIVILLAGYCFFYLMHGLFWERCYELAVFVCAGLILVCYVLINFVASHGWKDNVKIARLVVNWLVAIPVIYCGFKVVKEYHEQGRLVFYLVGARESLQVNCRRILLTEAFLHFDLQLTATLFVFNPSGTWYAYVFGSIFAIFWMITAFIANRQEMKPLCIIVFCLAVVQPGYAVYVIFKGIQTIIAASNDSATSRQIPYYMFANTAIAILVRIILFSLLISCFKNFGSGVKNKLRGPHSFCFDASKSENSVFEDNETNESN